VKGSFVGAKVLAYRVRFTFFLGWNLPSPIVWPAPDPPDPPGFWLLAPGARRSEARPTRHVSGVPNRSDPNPRPDRYARFCWIS